MIEELRQHSTAVFVKIDNMRLLLLNVLLLLAALIYATNAKLDDDNVPNFDDGAITADQLTALYKVANPKDIIQEMVKCNVTFFPLGTYQKDRKLRKKIKKYYKRYMRKLKKQKKLKKVNKVSSGKGSRSVYAVNQTMETIIASNIGMNIFYNVSLKNSD